MIRNLILKKELNHILLLPFILLLIIPLFISKNLLDFNTLHRLLFSISLLLLLLCIRFFKNKIKRVRINKIFLYILLLFLLSIILSSITNNSIILLFPDLFLYLTYFTFSFIVLILINIYSLEYMILVSSVVLSLVSFIIALLGILQSIHIDPFKLPEITGFGSTLISRIFVAEYIAAVIPWIFIPILKFRGKKIKIVFYILLFTVLYYIILLRGRAAYVSIFIGSIVLIFYYFKNKEKSEFIYQLKKTLLISLLILIICIGLNFLHSPDIERKDISNTIYSIVDKNYISNVYRFDAWNASIKMFLDNPFTGVGTSMWSGIFPKYNGLIFNDRFIYGNPHINPHNDYLEFLSENGVFTFVLYLSLIIFVFINILRNVNKSNLFIFIALSFLHILILSFFSFTKDRIASMLIFYLIIGIYLAFENSEKSSFSISTNAILTISFIILSINFIYIYQRYNSEKLYIKAIKYKMENEYNEMIKIFKNINQNIYPLDPNYMPLSYYEGIGYYSTNDYKTALEKFKYAIHLCPENPAIKNNLAAGYYSVGQPNVAEKMYSEIKKGYPNFIEPQINLLVIYYKSKKNTLARSLIQEIQNKELDNSINNINIFNQIRRFYYEAKTF